MLLEPRMDVWRKIAFDEIREEADEISATGLGAHSMSNCGLCAERPARETPAAPLVAQKSYPIQTEKRGLRNHLLPDVPSWIP
jgi:hypothetical protein